MKNMRIGIKVGLSLGMIFIALLFVSYSSLCNFNKIRTSASEVMQIKETLGTIYTFEEHITEAETGQRGYMITGEESFLEPFYKAEHHMDEHLEEIGMLLSDKSGQAQNFDELIPLIKQKKADMAYTIKILQEDGKAAAQEYVKKGVGKKLMEQIREVFDKMIAAENKLMHKKQAEMEQSYRRTYSAVFWTGGISLLLVILITIYLTKTIARPVEQAARRAAMIASGDLTEPIATIDRSDEVGKLINSLSSMSKVLLNQLTDIRSGIDVLSSSSSEIMSGVSQLAASASQTATAIGETTTTIEEVKQTAEVSNSKAQEVSSNSKKNARISQEGNKAIQETSESMLIIKQKMDMIANLVLNLNEQSHTIGEITATVNDLAEQSNILAVNAAIEAAKAGEQGKGFSVVAQEIKNLSSRSKEATAQVRLILNDVQKSINKVVMATEDGSRTVETGNELIKATREAIELLTHSVNLAAQASIQIASSSQQQLVGMDQVVVAMENIRDSSAQIASTTQQTSIAVNDLHRVGERLQELINFYKVMQ